jgi:hypothetical protein
MKEKIEDITYALTMIFCTSVIVLGIIGLVFKAIIHCSK